MTSRAILLGWPIAPPSAPPPAPDPEPPDGRVYVTIGGQILTYRGKPVTTRKT